MSVWAAVIPLTAVLTCAQLLLSIHSHYSEKKTNCQIKVQNDWKISSLSCYSGDQNRFFFSFILFLNNHKTSTKHYIIFTLHPITQVVVVGISAKSPLLGQEVGSAIQTSICYPNNTFLNHLIFSKWNSSLQTTHRISFPWRMVNFGPKGWPGPNSLLGKKVTDIEIRPHYQLKGEGKIIFVREKRVKSWPLSSQWEFCH